MVEFEVVTDGGFLGQKALPAGNTEKYRARFEGFLNQGVVLTGAVASVTGPNSTVATPTLSDDKKSVYWLITSSLVTEIFTLALAVTTNDGQTLNYTVIYNVLGPTALTSTPNPKVLIRGPTGATGANGAGSPLPSGTVDGQGIAWDNTAHQWVLVGIKQTMSYQIPEADLLAHTTQHIILHPGIGFTNSIGFLMVAVQKTVTTGGVIKLQIGGVDVAGATATIANGETPGTHHIVFATSANDYGFGDDVTIVLSGFSGAGILNVFITTSSSP